MKNESLGKSFYSLSFNFQKGFEFHSISHNQSNNQSNLSIYYNIPKFRILGCYTTRPNQTDNLKRLAKINQSYIKDFREESNIVHRYTWSQTHNSSDLDKHTAKRVTSNRYPRRSRRTFYWDPKSEKKPSS